MTEVPGDVARSEAPAGEQFFRQAEAVVVREIAGETLLIPVRGELAQLQQIFVLTEVGAFIWGQLDGQRNLAAVRDCILDAFDVPPNAAEGDLFEYIEELRQAGLVIEVTDSPG